MIMSWNMREQKNNGGNNCEKKLIKSTAGFFKEPETAGFRTRIERWAEGMENAYEAYPEALGDLLMDLGRLDKALEAYENSNQIWPGRLNTLMSAALAAKINDNQKLQNQCPARQPGESKCRYLFQAAGQHIRSGTYAHIR